MSWTFVNVSPSPVGREPVTALSPKDGFATLEEAQKAAADHGLIAIRGTDKRDYKSWPKPAKSHYTGEYRRDRWIYSGAEAYQFDLARWNDLPTYRLTES